MRNEPIRPADADRAVEIDPAQLDSVALQRLIAEVRQHDQAEPLDVTLYNRTYHRHNR
jgi:hypothetical protein